jgi:hypothetical protein
MGPPAGMGLDAHPRLVDSQDHEPYETSGQSQTGTQARDGSCRRRQCSVSARQQKATRLLLVTESGATANRQFRTPGDLRVPTILSRPPDAASAFLKQSAGVRKPSGLFSGRRVAANPPVLEAGCRRFDSCRPDHIARSVCLARPMVGPHSYKVQIGVQLVGEVPICRVASRRHLVLQTGQRSSILLRGTR